MILAIDVYYKQECAKAVGVLFNWDDEQPREIIIRDSCDVVDYVPGEFYKRELPSLLKIIENIDLNKLEAILIDGYVYIDNNRTFGLGGILWEKIDKSVPIIGVAKTSFFKNKETVAEIFRGESKKPLYISALDYPLDIAVKNIENMKGNFRMPTILKELDKITKA